MKTNELAYFLMDEIGDAVGRADERGLEPRDIWFALVSVLSGEIIDRCGGSFDRDKEKGDVFFESVIQASNTLRDSIYSEIPSLKELQAAKE